MYTDLWCFPSPIPLNTWTFLKENINMTTSSIIDKKVFIVDIEGEHIQRYLEQSMVLWHGQYTELGHKRREEAGEKRHRKEGQEIKKQTKNKAKWHVKKNKRRTLRRNKSTIAHGQIDGFYSRENLGEGKWNSGSREVYVPGMRSDERS